MLARSGLELDEQRLDEAMCEENNLDKIKELTYKLPSISEMISSTSNATFVEYDVDGVAFGVCLYDGTDIAVQRAFMSAESVFPEHSHGENTEFLLVYSGKLVVHICGEEKEIGPAEVIRVPPGVPHSVAAVADTWMIAAIIPPEIGYPSEH